jgi:signal transduction histidine kinase/CheY-like chemotaxis protein
MWELMTQHLQFIRFEWITGAMAFLACGYAILLGVDLFEAARQIISHKRERISRKGRQALTTPGQFLFTRCTQLKAEMGTLAWELKARALRELKIPELEWQHHPHAAQKAQNVQSTLMHVHKFIEKEFRCILHAVFLFSSEKGIFEYVGPPLPGRLQDQVFLQLAQASLPANRFQVLAQSAHERGGMNQAFTAFGIGRTLICAGEARGASPLQFALWLGYPITEPPTELEHQSLGVLVQKVRRYFETYAQVLALNREVEEAQHENEQKNDFIAHMSHDIRSPLNNIKAILTLFRLETNNPDWVELSEAAMHNCDSLGEIVDDLLDYSKHRAGRLEARKELVDVGMCLEDVVAGFVVSAKLKGVAVELESREDICCELDKRQLRRILVNLINNAIKYTQKGKVTVAVEKNGAKSIIRVSDTGIGMSESQVKALFTAFSRFQTETEGVGLGLVVTKILTELNGGEIAVHSREGEGTTFALYFPLSARSFGLNKSTDSAMHKTRILVVDDEAACVDSLARLLEREGYEVSRCYSVQDALAACNFAKPDFILSDSSMPEGGAERLLGAVSMLSPQPIVALLSGSDPAQVSPRLVERVFRKPVDFKELLSWLEAQSLAQRKLAAA